MKCAEVVRSPQQFDVGQFLRHAPELKAKNGRRQKERNRKYYNILCAFDIETSVLPYVTDRAGIIGPQSFMWVWMFQVGDICTIVGRTWDEYR